MVAYYYAAFWADGKYSGFQRNAARRLHCRAVFWQDLARAGGRDLSEFLAAKYGIG
jgi:hypothetical protein